MIATPCCRYLAQVLEIWWGYHTNLSITVLRQVCRNLRLSCAPRTSRISTDIRATVQHKSMASLEERIETACKNGTIPGAVMFASNRSGTLSRIYFFILE